MSEYSKKDWSSFAKKNQLEQEEIKAELKKLESKAAALKSSIAQRNEVTTDNTIETKEEEKLRIRRRMLENNLKTRRSAYYSKRATYLEARYRPLIGYIEQQLAKRAAIVDAKDKSKFTRKYDDGQYDSSRYEHSVFMKELEAHLQKMMDQTDYDFQIKVGDIVKVKGRSYLFIGWATYSLGQVEMWAIEGDSARLAISTTGYIRGKCLRITQDPLGIIFQPRSHTNGWPRFKPDDSSAGIDARFIALEDIRRYDRNWLQTPPHWNYSDFSKYPLWKKLTYLPGLYRECRNSVKFFDMLKYIFLDTGRRIF